MRLTGCPFYTGVSYMLVGMECLIGAAYTRKVEAAGVAGRADPSMGRVEAEYAEWRIGVLSRWAQLWIDRNVAPDYTLKSLEKIFDGHPHQVVRGLRRVLKTPPTGCSEKYSNCRTRPIPSPATTTSMPTGAHRWRRP